MADISGVSVENVSRRFSVMKDQGIIELVGKKIRILDRGRLIEMGKQFT